MDAEKTADRNRIREEHSELIAMSSLRTARMPIEHLTAELIAWPLVSESSFRLGVTSLHPLPALPSGRAGLVYSARANRPDSLTGQLWRTAETHLLATTSGVSIDELTSLRDGAWFDATLSTAIEHATAKIKPVPLQQYCRKIADWYVRSRGSTAVPCLVGFGADSDESSDSKANKARARESWRFLSWALPPVLVLAGIRTGADDEFPVEIETVPPQVSELLRRKGFNQPHLHMGAGLEFDSLWVSTQLGLGAGFIRESDFSSPGAACEEGRELASWLLRASLARFLLAWFLQYQGSLNGERTHFLNYFGRFQKPRLISRLGISSSTALQKAIRELIRGRLSGASTWFPHLQMIAGNLFNAGPKTRHVREGPGGQWASDRLIERLLESDPISACQRFSARPASHVSSELQFLRAGLDYLETQGTQDQLFARLFWQIIRVECLYYRHIVQRPLTPGLQWFIRTYDRLSPGKRILTTQFRTQSCLNSSGAGRGLSSIELRTAPDTSLSGTRQLIQGAADQVQASRNSQASRSGNRHCSLMDQPEVGFVFHIIRDRGGNLMRGIPTAHGLNSHADPVSLASANVTGYRFSSFYNQQKAAVTTLASIIQRFPLSLGWIRGIDTCTDEMGVPTWVIAPFFRYVRDVSARTSAWLRHQHGLEIPQIHTTVHAGEDFVHLLSGLRRIDESIRYFKLREGDRLGHCVALGLDATEWARSSGRVIMPLEERLLDLSWEWMCYARQGVPPSAERRAYLDREIARLSTLQFGKPQTPYELELLMESLHDEKFLQSVGFPNGYRTAAARSPHSKEIRELGFDYLQNRHVYLRGRRTVWVEPRDEAPALEATQRFLRERISSLGLTVEINPSSNYLIGDLGDLRSHPMWRLNPPAAQDELIPVPVCIGDDDPATFATSLRNEYGLLYDAILMSDESSVDALAWIDRVRDTGLRSRFTIPNAPRTPFNVIRRRSSTVRPPP